MPSVHPRIWAIDLPYGMTLEHWYGQSRKLRAHYLVQKLSRLGDDSFVPGVCFQRSLCRRLCARSLPPGHILRISAGQFIHCGASVLMYARASSVRMHRLYDNVNNACLSRPCSVPLVISAAHQIAQSPTTLLLHADVFGVGAHHHCQSFDNARLPRPCLACLVDARGQIKQSATGLFLHDGAFNVGAHRHHDGFEGACLPCPGPTRLVGACGEIK
mmetsp:Transcript_18883/g.30341  ORF Transcript_18883/g.30341 Transcript_18883/m.30341 type:complete len:216 (+) Transcript_18883:2067-2714(+)